MKANGEQKKEKKNLIPLKKIKKYQSVFLVKRTKEKTVNRVMRVCKL